MSSLSFSMKLSYTNGLLMANHILHHFTLGLNSKKEKWKTFVGSLKFYICFHANSDFRCLCRLFTQSMQPLITRGLFQSFPRIEINPHKFYIFGRSFLWRLRVHLNGLVRLSYKEIWTAEAHRVFTGA